MKKLTAVIFAFVAAVTLTLAAACFCGCSKGQTGGGNNALDSVCCAVRRPPLFGKGKMSPCLNDTQIIEITE